MSGKPGKLFERKIYAKIRNQSGLLCNPQRKVIGESDTIWRVDAVLFDGDNPVTYLEIKYVGEKSSYETQYKLAFAQMADFSYSNIPGAVIVPEKRKPGNKNWDKYFAAIGCVLIAERQLGDFLDTLQEFPTAPETSDPLEDFLPDELHRNLGTEPLDLVDDGSQDSSKIGASQQKDEEEKDDLRVTAEDMKIAEEMIDAMEEEIDDTS